MCGIAGAAAGRCQQLGERAGAVPVLGGVPERAVGGGRCRLCAGRPGGGDIARGLQGRGVKAYSYRRVKNKRDAGDLADLLRMGPLPEAWIAPPEIRELREITRYRAQAGQGTDLATLLGIWLARDTRERRRAARTSARPVDHVAASLTSASARPVTRGSANARSPV